MRYGGGFGLGTIVYLIIGAFVAGTHHYFQHVSRLGPIVSAVLAILLWPLVLFGVHLHIK
jgi:cell shape-determining protein MreD